jgi:hypothetical protein
MGVIASLLKSLKILRKFFTHRIVIYYYTEVSLYKAQTIIGANVAAKRLNMSQPRLVALINQGRVYSAYKPTNA